tara:strand:+ start:824 stop:1495 length:672 start_codon:yes stop_codon:yes gene_type:complete
MPPLPVDESIEAGENVSLISLVGTGKEIDLSLWDDEDTRAFYEDLPKLRELLPAVLCGGKVEKESASDDKENVDSSAQTEAEGQGGKKDENSEGAEGQEKEKEEGEKEGDAKDDDDDEDNMLELEIEEEGEVEKQDGVALSPLEELLAKMPTCDSREKADDLALQFCYINTKAARKRLMLALFRVPRNMLHLLPFYARFVGCLYPIMEEIGDGLVRMLLKEFR